MRKVTKLKVSNIFFKFNWSIEVPILDYIKKSTSVRSSDLTGQREEKSNVEAAIWVIS